MGIWHIWFLFSSLSLSLSLFPSRYAAVSISNVWMIIRSNTFIVNALSLHQLANIYVTHSPIHSPASFYISTFYSLCEWVCVCVDDLSTKRSIMCVHTFKLDHWLWCARTDDHYYFYVCFFHLFLDFDAICFGWRMCALHIPCSWQCQHGLYYIFSLLPRMQTATWHALHTLMHSALVHIRCSTLCILHWKLLVRWISVNNNNNVCLCA